MNTKYETVTLRNGRKLTRRNPKIPFKPPRKKPENGASIKVHKPGKMLKAIQIMDRQYAGKLLRFFFNGFGYQLRLAEAERKMLELELPDLSWKELLGYDAISTSTQAARDPEMCNTLSFIFCR